MRACLLQRQRPVDASPLSFMPVAPPAPGPGEVLVRVAACAVCRTDLHIIEGDLPLRRAPLIPGHQAVGVVAALGDGVREGEPRIGDRVGVAWLHRTCAACRFCSGGRENLCENADFTGWTVDGGYAEYCVAPADFVYPLPAAFNDLQAAPLLCAGIIGARALRLTGLDEQPDGWKGARLGMYGFGAAAHIAVQVARSRGAEVCVFTRDPARNESRARKLGAAWVGETSQAPPGRLGAAIIFAPAGELVPRALCAVDKGGVLVLAGIHMSPVPPLEYSLLYDERIIRSVTNNTREDGRAFLAEAAAAGVQTQIEAFPLARANEALQALKRGAIRGAAVLVND